MRLNPPYHQKNFPKDIPFNQFIFSATKTTECQLRTTKNYHLTLTLQGFIQSFRWLLPLYWFCFSTCKNVFLRVTGRQFYGWRIQVTFRVIFRTSFAYFSSLKICVSNPLKKRWLLEHTDRRSVHFKIAEVLNDKHQIFCFSNAFRWFRFLLKRKAFVCLVLRIFFLKSFQLVWFFLLL